jgi:hypothetical protein
VLSPQLQLATLTLTQIPLFWELNVTDPPV